MSLPEPCERLELAEEQGAHFLNAVSTHFYNYYSQFQMTRQKLNMISRSVAIYSKQHQSTKQHSLDGFNTRFLVMCYVLMYDLFDV